MMEASQTGPGNEGTEGTDEFGQPLAEGQAGSEAGDGGADEASAGTAAPVESAADEQPSEDERNPAPEQSPAATEAQEAIVGDQGSRDEQQPTPSVGSQDIPVRTSAPPPNAQSGVPLPEDRAAGVEPGPSGPAVEGGEELDEDETPEHDASEGQSTTPPMG